MVQSELLSIILPIFNEKDTVTDVLRRLDTLPFEKEIIVVDDGSTDGSLQILQNWTSSPIKLMIHPENRGKGAAILTGAKIAEGDLIVIQDADLELDPSDLPRLLECFQTDFMVDAVLGDRLSNYSDRKTIYFYGNLLMSWITSFLFGRRVRDVMVGYKMIRKQVFRNLNLRARGFDIEPEIVGRLLKKHCKIQQIPIKYKPRTKETGKKIKVSHGFKIVWTLIRIRCDGKV